MKTQLDIFDSVWIEDAIPIVMREMRGRTFTTDDLHPLLTVPKENKLYGVLIAVMQGRGLIRHIDYVKSNRREANGRKVRSWQLTPNAAPPIEECAAKAVLNKIAADAGATAMMKIGVLR